MSLYPKAPVKILVTCLALLVTSTGSTEEPPASQLDRRTDIQRLHVEYKRLMKAESNWKGMTPEQGIEILKVSLLGKLDAEVLRDQVHELLESNKVKCNEPGYISPNIAIEILKTSAATAVSKAPTKDTNYVTALYRKVSKTLGKHMSNNALMQLIKTSVVSGVNIADLVKQSKEVLNETCYAFGKACWLNDDGAAEIVKMNVLYNRGKSAKELARMVGSIHSHWRQNFGQYTYQMYGLDGTVEFVKTALIKKLSPNEVVDLYEKHYGWGSHVFAGKSQRSIQELIKLSITAGEDDRNVYDMSSNYALGSYFSRPEGIDQNAAAEITKLSFRTNPEIEKLLLLDHRETARVDGERCNGILTREASVLQKEAERFKDNSSPNPNPKTGQQ